ncbi:MAG TPA: bifunctional alpha/beta hydrolase/class I SAM-dependent methyltransferase [Thermoanaerobaculia bacterium]|nr:bifunctional alpha/beta hydrolase/class I SAM-dependent methyltransferase [Thermoanaerobaculia bacterium]
MRAANEGTFRCADGTELFYRHWPASGDGPRRALAMFHRGHEHSGRLQHLVDELDLPGFDFFAWDARGHGRSPGERGFSPGIGTSVNDIDVFVRHLEAAHGVAPEGLAVVAQSVGSVLVAAWAHDYAPRVRCLVLASPAFAVRLYVPLARPGLGLLHKLRGHFYINSYVKAKLLTHDPERIRSYEEDPLITRAISVNILLGLYAAGERVVADAGAIRIPTQVLISGDDWVVDKAPQHAFYERLGAAVKEKLVFDGFYHDTLGERDRARPIAAARAFILRSFEQPGRRSPLLDADREGFTRAEMETLQRPAPLPKRVYFGLTRLGMRTLGRLSEGVRLGLATGFDSGSTLDYVYQHQPRGVTPLGRRIDRGYLESIGWRGIRVRRRHLEQALVATARRLQAAGRPVRVLDVAAGHGRYVLAALGDVLRDGDRIELRDWSPLNVDKGSALITALGLQERATFRRGDAFDGEELARAAPRPTLGVVSGLYELFPENGPVRRSLGGLAAAIEPGGYLLYTNQPWHPQLELIARTLTSHRDGAPWVMRRRTQEEMDDLVAAAGFRKLEQWIDEWGIFSVSLAEMPAA